MEAELLVETRERHPYSFSIDANRCSNSETRLFQLSLS